MCCMQCCLPVSVGKSCFQSLRVTLRESHLHIVTKHIYEMPRSALHVQTREAKKCLPSWLSVGSNQTVQELSRVVLVTAAANP